MKIRIKGNSVRYRLSKSEITKLIEVGCLEDSTQFISNTLVYELAQKNSGELSADFCKNRITIYVPQAMLQSWAETEQVGVDCHMPLPGGDSLYILVEKDFKCIDAPITEDQSDYFENPHLTC